MPSPGSKTAPSSRTHQAQKANPPANCKAGTAKKELIPLYRAFVLRAFVLDTMSFVPRNPVLTSECLNLKGLLKDKVFGCCFFPLLRVVRV
jgi:hypothetical protein